MKQAQSTRCLRVAITTAIAIPLAFALTIAGATTAAAQSTDDKIIAVVPDDQATAITNGFALALKSRADASLLHMLVTIDAPALMAQLTTGPVELPMPDGSRVTLPQGQMQPGQQSSTQYWGAIGDQGLAAITTIDGILFADIDLGTGRVWSIRPADSGSYLFALQAEEPHLRDEVLSPTPRLPVDAAPRPVDRDNPKLADDVVITEAWLNARGGSHGLPEVAASFASPNHAINLLQAPRKPTLMVWHDDSSITWFGSFNSASSEVVQRINQMNSLLAAQGVTVEVQLVGQQHEPGQIDSTANGVVLDAVRDPDDGRLDAIHNARQSLNADLAHYITSIDACGVANRPPSAPNDITQDLVAFGITSPDCLGQTLTLAHELGHNFSLLHDQANSGGSAPSLPGAYGYVQPQPSAGFPTGYTTLMSYRTASNGCASCVEVPWFSSTSTTGSGFTIGHPTANNLPALDVAATWVEQYRPDGCPNPANDYFGHATVLASSTFATGSGDLRCASVQDGEPLNSSEIFSTVSSVWFSWTAPNNGTATASTCLPGTQIDTWMAVYDMPASGSIYDLDTGTSLVNDEGVGCAQFATGSPSKLFFTAQQGKTYIFQVDGYASSAANLGTFDLSISLAALSLTQGNSNGIVGGVPEMGDRFGTEVTTGDFNGDGYDDLAVGTPDEDIGTTTNAGTVTIVRGGPTGLTGAARFWHQNSSGVAGVSEANDRFGESLAAGDINGDGYDDLIVGAPREAIGPRAGAGLVQVFLGSQSGLVPANTFHQNSPGIQGNAESGDGFGSAVITGDFNNDNIDDVAIGVPGENRGSTIDTGLIHILFGSANGVTSNGSKVWSQSSAGVAGRAEARDRFGDALASGDFDGDGTDDLAVGSPGEDVGPHNAAGLIHVFRGQSTGFAGATAISQSTPGILGSAERNDAFGAVLTSADFNGDGFDDLAVGSPGEAIGPVAGAGMVHTIDGSSSGLNPATTFAFHQNLGGLSGTAEAGDEFGAALAAGNVNGDGRADLLVGSPGEAIGPKVEAGTAHLLLGSPNGVRVNGSQIHHVDQPWINGGAAADEQFASAVAIGDFDQDGLGDLVLPGPGERAVQQDAGRISIAYGPTP